MARLISLALAVHPRMGPSFVIRFSWNSRVENPIERVKNLAASEREYDPESRRWWVAATHLDLLAELFENWPEEVAVLAAAHPRRFSAVVTEVLRDRIRATIGAVLDAAPVVPGDQIMAAFGGALGLWLEEWRRGAPDAAALLPPDRLGEIREAAREARAQQRTWVQRAAFTCEFLAPESDQGGDAGGRSGSPAA